jgi:hypothetical protein
VTAPNTLETGAITNWLSADWGFRKDSPLAYSYPMNPPPADFGHMPIFDNSQPVNDPVGYFAQAQGAGPIPWGTLVFDYFTTINPATIPGGDVRKVPGRININAAPWYVLAGLPVIAPKAAYGGDLVSIAPQYRPGGNRNFRAPSPAFWRYASGILVGDGSGGGPVPTLPAGPRFNVGILGTDISGTMWHRLGGNLALAMASYRDRVAYQQSTDPGYPAAFNRNQIPTSGNFAGDPRAQYRFAATYGPLRRENPGAAAKFGFVTIGELANVQGFDQAVGFNGVPNLGITPGGTAGALSEVLHYDSLTLDGPDFMKAVALLALIDSQYLTTRGNTFTVYVTVYDRENPQASVRSQMTVDRGNTLPRVIRDMATGQPLSTIDGQPLPEIIAERRIGYFNAAYDD